jgi:HAD superfamily (subfamily IA) hydrolase, TIGR02254
MKRFKTLLFDADNTLFDFDACEKEALRLAFQKYGYTLEEQLCKVYSGINLDLWKQYEKGLIDRNVLIYKRFEILFDKYGFSYDVRKFEDDYQELLGMQHFFMEDAYDVIEKLHAEYDLYIVTNGVTATQLRRFHDSTIDRFMKDIFVSEQTGSQKPKKEYFDYCFERIENFDRDRIMIIGDSLSSDITGGYNAGIATCWYNPDGHANPADIKADYVIRKLTELYDIV